MRIMPHAWDVSTMRNIKMIVAYVGTRYSGWQVQPNRETIQGVLEARLSGMLQERVRLAGAGRTDAGVHARGQVANFSTATSVPLDGLRRGLNARLPDDIRVLRADEVDARFHARADARSKEYRYRIARAEVVSPFDAPFAAVVRGHIDVGAMSRAAERFVGTHDFDSFCPAGCAIDNKRRTIHLSRVFVEGDFLEYRVRANGFLQHMVRTIAGTLIDIGRGRRDSASVDAILAARDRRAAGPCAPPRGLVLEEVFYGEGTT